MLREGKGEEEGAGKPRNQDTWTAEDLEVTEWLGAEDILKRGAPGSL